MKRNQLLIIGRLVAVVMALMMMPTTARADVEITEATFPDETFRAWLQSQKYGQDGIITDDEIAEYVHDTIAHRAPYYAQAQLQFDATRIETAEETEETAQEFAELLTHHIN